MEAGHQRAEVRAHPRHRGGRQDHPARHVLPDERQLLLRRLLQGRRDQLRLGAGHRRPGRRRLRPRPASGSGRRSTSTTTRRRSSGASSPACPAERIVRRGKEDNYWSMGVPGPGGPCTRDLHRPRPGVRRRGRPGGRRGPLPGDLEPRLHAERAAARAAARTTSTILGDAAGQEHRHRHGPGADRLLLQGVDNLYEIDEVYPVLERAAELAGKRYGAGRARRGAQPPDDVRLRVVADHVRSCADAHRRRRHPRQRGPRLRAAPDAPPRRPLDAAARRRRSPCLPELLPVSMDRMKAVLPRARARLRRGSPGIAYAEEEAFRRTLAAGTTILDTAVARREVVRSHRPGRRRGVPAARHLRLPDRPDPGDGGRAGRRRRRGGLPPADDRAARAGQGRRPGQEDRHGDTSAYRGVADDARPRRRVHRLRRGHHRGAGRGPARRRRVRHVRAARATRSSWSSTARRSTPRAAASSPTPAGSSWPTAPSSRSATCRRRSRA